MLPKKELLGKKDNSNEVKWFFKISQFYDCDIKCTSKFGGDR